MVVHVRRGDYAHHYKFLAKCSSDYMGWCKTHGVSDTFDPPGDSGVETEEKNALYEAHGYPSQERISRRIREIRKKWEARSDSQASLRSLHIMTNGDREWIRELKERIAKESGENAWDHISSAHDLNLNNEQRYVTIAIDQAIADRAEVFVGNGVSRHTNVVNLLTNCLQSQFTATSANVVLMRRIHGIVPPSIHFWSCGERCKLFLGCLEGGVCPIS